MLTAAEPSQKAWTPSVGKKTDGSKPTKADDTAARLRKEKRDEIKNNAPTPEKAPKPKPKSASKKNPARPDGIIDKVDDQGNWTYVFGQDNMSGDKLGACITLRAKPWHDEPQDMECITKLVELQEGFRSTLKNDSPDDADAPANELDSIYANNEEELKNTYANAMACLNPCLKQGYEGKGDLQFLYDCVDWAKVRETWQKGDRGEISANTIFEGKSPYACSEDALLKGAREGRYQAWTRDPKTSACVRCAKPGWHWSETERRCVVCEKGEHWSETERRCVVCEKGEHWSEKESCCIACAKDEYWDGAQQKCVKATPQMREAREIGRKFQTEFERTYQCPQGVADFYKLQKLAATIIRQGYPTNPLPMGKTHNLACGYHADGTSFYATTKCVNDLTCYDQGRAGLPWNCLKFVRSSPDSALFVLRGTSCHDGSRSWRQGGHHGDLRLIPIAPKVWLQTYEASGSGLFYTGLVFSD